MAQCYVVSAAPTPPTTYRPSGSPSKFPTRSPTGFPTVPTNIPTLSPISSAPTSSPVIPPTKTPTLHPACLACSRKRSEACVANQQCVGTGFLRFSLMWNRTGQTQMYVLYRRIMSTCVF